MVTIAQLDFDHLYIPRTTQGQPWPLALGSGFLISPTDPGPAGPRDLASPTDPGPAGPVLALAAPLLATAALPAMTTLLPPSASLSTPSDPY